MITDTAVDALAADARANAVRVAALRRDLSDAALTWRPDPSTWSVAEITQHLVTTTELYEPRMEALLPKALERAPGRRPFRPRRFAAWFIKMAGPESEKKLKAPKRFDPSSGDVGAEVLDRFVAQQEGLLELMGRAADADLNRPRLGSPLTPLLRFSLGEAFLLLVRHQQRHLRQAERLLQHDAFPG